MLPLSSIPLVMAMRDIQIRRGVKTLALCAVGVVTAVILFKMLLPTIVTIAIVAFVVWMILRALRA